MVMGKSPEEREALRGQLADAASEERRTSTGNVWKSDDLKVELSLRTNEIMQLTVPCS